MAKLVGWAITIAKLVVPPGGKYLCPDYEMSGAKVTERFLTSLPEGSKFPEDAFTVFCEERALQRHRHGRMQALRVSLSQLHVDCENLFILRFFEFSKMHFHTPNPQARHCATRGGWDYSNAGSQQEGRKRRVSPTPHAPLSKEAAEWRILTPRRIFTARPRFPNRAAPRQSAFSSHPPRGRPFSPRESISV